MGSPPRDHATPVLRGHSARRNDNLPVARRGGRRADFLVGEEGQPGNRGGASPSQRGRRLEAATQAPPPPSRRQRGEMRTPPTRLRRRSPAPLRPSELLMNWSSWLSAMGAWSRQLPVPDLHGRPILSTHPPPPQVGMAASGGLRTRLTVYYCLRPT